MGVWGYELFQNDMSLDIKDGFEKLYNNGKSVQEATDKLLEEYKSIMGDIDEEPLFWFALAETQWNLGVLISLVKDKALCWVEKAKDMLNYQQIDVSAKAKRKEVLCELETKLLSPMPPVKIPAKKRLYQCQWELGDVFAYQLDSDLAKKRGLYGRYFLIQKVDEGVWHPGHIVPIVYIKITSDTALPSSIEAYNQLEYVQTRFTKYEERFWPIDMSRPQEDIAEKSKMNYKVDEYGFLPQYRIMLLNTSKKIIPSKLIYVGNFSHATCPKNEFIPHSKTNISPVFWKKFDETFETKMIKLYCGHNLRELSVYTDKSI